jgi:hypothetical protein
MILNLFIISNHTKLLISKSCEVLKTSQDYYIENQLIRNF